MDEITLKALAKINLDWMWSGAGKMDIMKCA